MKPGPQPRSSTRCPGPMPARSRSAPVRSRQTSCCWPSRSSSTGSVPRMYSRSLMRSRSGPPCPRGYTRGSRRRPSLPPAAARPRVDSPIHPSAGAPHVEPSIHRSRRGELLICRPRRRPNPSGPSRPLQGGPMPAIETTPALVADAYARIQANLATVRERLGRPLTYAEKILLGHLADPRRAGARAGRVLPGAPPRPRGHAGRHRADGHPPVHLERARRDGGAHHRPLRPPDPGLPGRGRGHGDRAGNQPRGLRLPSQRERALRHRLLGAGRGHHPPGGAREVRLSRRHDDRNRFPHAERGAASACSPAAWAVRTPWT